MSPVPVSGIKAGPACCVCVCVCLCGSDSWLFEPRLGLRGGKKLDSSVVENNTHSMPTGTEFVAGIQESHLLCCAE